MMAYSSKILDGCTLSLKDIQPKKPHYVKVPSNHIVIDFDRTNYQSKHFTFVPSIKKVIFNPPATIILWEDGTKTVVKAMKSVEFNPYYGFTAAVTKKVFDSNSRISHIVESGEWWPRPKPARTESLNCKEEK